MPLRYDKGSYEGYTRSHRAYVAQNAGGKKGEGFVSIFGIKKPMI